MLPCIEMRLASIYVATDSAMADAVDLANDVKSLHLNGTNENGEKSQVEKHADNWGFPPLELYKLALKFYKEKEGKAIHLSYRHKVKLVAYTKQATHGKYRNDISPDVGFLDVVGNDRRQAWQSLGDMSKESAMTEFVKLLDSLSPLFRPYVDAHKAENEEKLRKKKQDEERRKREEEEREKQRLEDEARRQLEAERQKQLEQEMQIRAALNQQTTVQFKQYAEQQCPNNREQQEELIRQLQEQHFQQYMQQIYQQQLAHQQQQYKQLHKPAKPEDEGPSKTQENGPVTPNTEENQAKAANTEEVDELLPLAAARIWTRKDVKEFKESLNKEKDSVIKIGSGETVTVRVPTHMDGTCLFWEFATDYYDIGFGVYFEWTVAPNSTVSVHVSESSDEEDLDEEGDEKGDVERGGRKQDENRPPTDEIIPVYRRDSHEEVYCGSHAYPGQGVYLLKFDNSYSLWRSKTLYYRVYYSR